MNKLLLVSFDAVGDAALDALSALPNTAAFLKESALVRNVRSAFVTNTYPVHTTIVTGLSPGGHGLVSNTPPFPEKHPLWNYSAHLIKAKTLWQAVYEKGGTTAAVLWPVTAQAREIRWNLPEIMPRPGDNQILLNLKNGSVFTQLRLALKYARLLDGIHQPALDRFSSSCMTDLLRSQRPTLALMHLTAYDTLCHKGGPGSALADQGLEALDQSLGRLLQAAGPEYAALLFSDHSQLFIEKELFPNDLLVEAGLLGKGGDGDYAPGKSGCFFECCGGSAFFRSGSLGPEQTAKVKAAAAESQGFNRFLTPDEMAEAGMTSAAFGFCAARGFCYAVEAEGYKGQHGYPADYDGYSVFYAVRSPQAKAGAVFTGGSLMDIAPLALRLLGDGLPEGAKPAIPGLNPCRAELFR